MPRLLLLLFVLLPGVAGAASIEVLKGLLEQTTTARARFAQMVLDKNLKMLQQATGTMQFSRPGKFRWEYDKPFEQTIVSDGTRVWLYDKDLNQVTVRRFDRALGSSPAALLAGSNEIDPRVEDDHTRRADDEVCCPGGERAAPDRTERERSVERSTARLYAERIVVPRKRHCERENDRAGGVSVDGQDTRPKRSIA